MTDIDWNKVAAAQAQAMMKKDTDQIKTTGIKLVPEHVKRYCEVVFTEKGWNTGCYKDLYIRTNGYFMNLVGDCPIHKYQHHSNFPVLVQPPYHAKNARIICPHDGSVMKLDFPMNVLIC